MTALHLLWLPEGEPPVYLSFADGQALRTWWIANRPSQGLAYVFRGERMAFTSGPYRYLVDGGDLLPLFEEPLPGPVTDDPSLFGAQGADPDYLALTDGPGH